MKRIPAKRVDVAQAVGMDKNTERMPTVFADGIQKLMGRRAVKISPQLQVKIIAVLTNKDLKICCQPGTRFLSRNGPNGSDSPFLF